MEMRRRAVEKEEEEEDDDDDDDGEETSQRRIMTAVRYQAAIVLGHHSRHARNLDENRERRAIEIAGRLLIRLRSDKRKEGERRNRWRFRSRY